MSEHGKITIYYTKQKKIRYKIDIWHKGLGQQQTIRGTNQNDVWQKAQKKMQQWDQMAERQKNKHLATEKTLQAQEELQSLEKLLLNSVEIDNSFDWVSLKDFSDYGEAMPVMPVIPKMGFIRKLVPTWRENFERKIKEQEDKHKEELVKWENRRTAFLQERNEKNILVDKRKEKYLSGDYDSIIDYCDLVLSNSKYPEYFPQEFEVDYNPENKLLIVEYQLPSPESIPTLREVVYVQSRNSFTEKRISKTQLNNLYDSLVYQVILRTIHEIYQSDKLDAFQSVVFNGYVKSIDPATGHEVFPCILTLQVSRDEFESINLEKVDPKVCFKTLKGIGSSKLHSLTPIAPIMKIDKEDARFVSSYGVAEELDDTVNIAVMDWEDFEHLVRELFEKEFTSTGGEVKVTQASRDGGVDAVAFDPDPIRGGKIVIQAKRYSSTVGVSAVRDLYGTVMNEGATKGVLVTTSDYGPDAYEFAKGKPLVLLNGGNLLHLLEKHGHKARINLKEAKKILGGKTR